MKEVNNWFFGSGLEIIQDGGHLEIYDQNRFIGHIFPDDMNQTVADLNDGGNQIHGTFSVYCCDDEE